MPAKRQDKLLGALREAPGVFLSGERLSEELGVTRAAIWKEVQALRAMGYEIVSSTHRGYALQSAPDKLFSDEIQHELRTKRIGKEIFSYESLDSTNTTAWRLGMDGVKEGACVFAEHQKKGRGRLGRAWSSPKEKNILFSVLLRPKLAPSEVSRLTLAAGLAVVEAVKRQTGIVLGLKWPNDVLWGDKKVCGILTEMNAEADRVHFVVLGIGLNVNSASSDLLPQAASLREIAEKKTARVPLARAILEELERFVDMVGAAQMDALCEIWENHSLTTGRRVAATVLDRTVEGTAVGIDRDGALWIRKDNGLQERILSGDIQHLRGAR